MPSRTEAEGRNGNRAPTARDRWGGIALLAACLLFFAIYADGQAEHTFRFVAELLVGDGG